MFGWYERYPHWRRALCDADRLEVLAQGVRWREHHLVELVRAALGQGADANTVATARALI